MYVIPYRTLLVLLYTVYRERERDREREIDQYISYYMCILYINMFNMYNPVYINRTIYIYIGQHILARRGN